MAERGWWGGLLDETAKLPQGIRQLVVDAVTRQLRTDPTQPVVTPGPGGLLDLTPVPGFAEAYKASDDVGKGGYEGGQAVGKYLSGLLGIIPAVGAVRKAGPIRAYHGSPHDFDKFDLNKIGTGEGAQAYGHGLYFAENPTVASSYKNPNQRPVPIAYGGAEYTDQTIRGRTLDDIQLIGKDAALQKLKDNIRFNEKYAPDMARLYQSELDWAAGVDPSKINVRRGHMYDVNIHADPAKMLNWDKPLSGQSADVQKAVGQLPSPVRMLRDPLGNPAPQYGEPMGREIYEKLTGIHQSEYPGATRGAMPPAGYNSAALATDDLKALGIPGIKYLDQGSRTAGQGSSNYVVFDPAIIEILRKYGLVPATVAAGVGGAAAVPGLLNEEKQY